MKGKSLAVIGTQYGDEGKGKIVDFLSEKADYVVRYQGGANAGHTITVGEKEVILHQIPSGIVRGKKCVMGRGMVINPVTLKEEIEMLENSNFSVKDNLIIDPGAHIVLPKHIDYSKSESGTGKGIAPCYGDKSKKFGLRFYDLINKIEDYDKFDLDARQNIETYQYFLDKHRDLSDFIRETSFELYLAKENGKNILFEGAQAIGLDIDMGQYPESTSSNTGVGGIIAGTGVSHKFLDKVVGIAKAYVTRVDKNGAGPLVTQINGKIGDYLRENGDEYGSTTGRPRRCGWFDVPLVKHSILTNGIENLILTKLDVLGGLDNLKIANYYENCSEIKGYIADAPSLRKLTPHYENLSGWQEDISSCKKINELPKNARKYVDRLEELLKIPIDISVGPERNQTIIRRNYWV
jgi:adenylosuccinate synthase